MSLWTRIRGGFIIAMMWGILWQILVSILTLYSQIFIQSHGHPFDVRNWIHQSLRVWPLGLGLGFVVGMGFVLLVAAGERERTVGSLSALRVALWGAIASGMLSGIAIVTLIMPAISMTHVFETMGVFAAIGAASAAGTLALARGGSERAALPGSRFTLPAE